MKRSFTRGEMHLLKTVSCLLLLEIGGFTKAQNSITSPPVSTQGAISNPYYNSPTWKLWATDSSTVIDGSLFAPGQVGQMAKTLPANRLYPDDIITKGKFMEFRKTDWPGRKYAGFWDDVYFSVDGNGTNPETPHSYISQGYFSDVLNSIYFGGDKWLNGYKGNIQNDPGIDNFGVNWISQSTTYMGSDISAGKSNGTGSPYGPNSVEKDWYFKNCLRAGPAHVSYVENDNKNMHDTYEALMPCYYNSLGSSGTEVYALEKMLIAGGFLPKALKPELKRQGIYTATMLYIFKACLPFDSPYDNEMKHRVCYASNGGYVVSVSTENRPYHTYNDSLHMAAMINMAKNMAVAPPIALLKRISVTGGTEQYFNKTTALIHQAAGESITIQFSTADCYDIASLPLTKKLKLLCGNPNTTITGSGDNYTITVPYDAHLPQGRTTIMLTANNGSYDSNPACINIYRIDGSVNQRPVISGAADTIIFPGGTVAFNLKGVDPEGYTCAFYKRTQDSGMIAANKYTWVTNTLTRPGKYPIAIICSDGTTGIDSRQYTITVNRIIAKASATPPSGPTPLTVNFSSAGSIDMQGNPLTYFWDFDDGTTSTSANPQHIYTSPGYYRATLAVTSSVGSDTARVIVKSDQNPWHLDINNGWDSIKHDPALWAPINLANGRDTVVNHVLKLYNTINSTTYGIQTVKSYNLPLYLEADFLPYYPKPNDGFILLGNQLGWDYFSDPFSFTNLSTTKLTNIGQCLLNERVTLRIFVTADPKNSGKARYAGYLESALGNYFFSINNQSYTPGVLQNIEHGSSEDCWRLQIWSPNNSTGVPFSQAANVDNAIGYPNPFNINSGGSFIVSGFPANCTMDIFTITGTKIRSLKALDASATNNNQIMWDGKNNAGEEISSGIYLYTIKNPGGYNKAGKIGVVK